jgi:hypothetical protein
MDYDPKSLLNNPRMQVLSAYIRQVVLPGLYLDSPEHTKVRDTRVGG